jgi:hypothetical protein
MAGGEVVTAIAIDRPACTIDKKWRNQTTFIRICLFSSKPVPGLVKAPACAVGIRAVFVSNDVRRIYAGTVWLAVARNFIVTASAPFFFACLDTAVGCIDPVVPVRLGSDYRVIHTIVRSVRTVTGIANISLGKGKFSIRIGL